MLSSLKDGTPLSALPELSPPIFKVPRVKPHWLLGLWFSKPNVMWIHLPHVGSLCLRCLVGFAALLSLYSWVLSPYGWSLWCLWLWVASLPFLLSLMWPLFFLALKNLFPDSHHFLIFYTDMEY